MYLADRGAIDRFAAAFLAYLGRVDFLVSKAGWEKLGYLTIIPCTASKRDAHAEALVRRKGSGSAFDYAVVSSKTVTSIGSFASDDKARDPFLDRTLEVYGTPTPTPWKAYYLPAGANGNYDLRLVDPVKNGLKPFKESL